MTLKTQMAADVAAVFLNTDEFAESATYTPDGAASSFACTVVPGDIDPGFGMTASGQADRRICPFFASLSALQAGILGILGSARDPLRLDTLTFASGSYVGDWSVERCAPDGEDGITIYAHQEVRHQVAAPGVIGAGG